MDTQLADFIRDTPAGKVAGEILRKCVHCGFCTATCPTYQLLGDELDGPRGRIYLIKQVLEGKAVSEKTRDHLDRCLTCRSCETTCPSGVKYSHLLDIGRAVVEDKLPRRLADKLPPVLAAAKPWPTSGTHPRRMLALAGCVQPALAPNINAATARVLDRLGISLFEADGAGCCGAVRFHLNAQDDAKQDMRRNIDAWWPHIEAGVEAIVVTASGCGVQVRDYGHILADDAVYAEKAAKISALCRDPAEVVTAEAERLRALLPKTGRGPLAFHSPCTLQHGLKIRGVIESLLTTAGYTLTAVADGHLCCGSAGTYSVLQPALSKQLRDNKLSALNAGAPAVIATANIGCQTHLQSGSLMPVRHWIELIDEALT